MSDGVSIDTRTLKPGNLFFAIKGPTFNGNEYALEALRKGASYAVVDEEIAGDDRLIQVEDSTKALQDLAIFHRSRYKRVLFGLTGSNGKTTTKELLTEVLQRKYIVHSTAGNYNNHLGVPLTLLHIYPQVEIAVIEMGANHVGEIAQLSGFAKPTHGLITNIGKAHTETFGGIEGVLRGKSELFHFLRENDGTVFLNTNDHRLKAMSKRFKTFQAYPEADVTLLGADPYLKVQIGTETCNSLLIGEYNFENIASAVSVGRFFGVPDKDISEAISAYRPGNLRSEVVEKNGIRLIMDAYNANPDSMKAAIENLAAMGGKKMAILGEMNELENEEEEHRRLGELVKERNIFTLFIGNRLKEASGNNSNCEWFETKEEASKYVKEQSLSGTTILLKASRTHRLETMKETIFGD